MSGDIYIYIKCHIKFDVNFEFVICQQPMTAITWNTEYTTLSTVLKYNMMLFVIFKRI